MNMTKVEAIKKVMEAHEGKATLSQIYNETKRYKKDVDQADDWKAGLRGVLYREVRNGRNFKKVDEATYGLVSLKGTKTIQVSEDIYKRLVELKEDFEDVHSIRFSFDDVIGDTLDIALEVSR